MDMIPDFGLDDVDPSAPGPVSAVPAELPGKVGVPSPSSWGGLALELLLAPHDVAGICATYRTTPEIVLAMLGKGVHPQVSAPVESFRVAMREAKREIESLGPNAGHVLRTRTIAERSLFRLDTIANNPASSPQLALKAIEMLHRYGRLDPGLEKKASEASAAPAVGVIVNFSFGKGLPVPEAMTIDAHPTQPPEV